MQIQFSIADIIYHIKSILMVINHLCKNQVRGSGLSQLYRGQMISSFVFTLLYCNERQNQFCLSAFAIFYVVRLFSLVNIPTIARCSPAVFSQPARSCDCISVMKYLVS